MDGDQPTARQPQGYVHLADNTKADSRALADAPAAAEKASTWPQYTKTLSVLAVALLSMLFGALMLFSCSMAYFRGRSAGPMYLSGDYDVCYYPDYSKKTLKTAYEETVFALLSDTREEKKFEASEVIYVNETFWVVCDNSWALGRFDRTLRPFSPDNRQIGDPKNEAKGGDSQWEALVYDRQRHLFLAVQEAVPLSELRKERKGHKALKGSEPESGFRGVVQELRLKGHGGKEGYVIDRECEMDFTFEHGNKGFEGAVGLRDTKGELYLLGLCEGNFCKGGKEGKRPGNGRMILLRRDDTDGRCQWKSMRTIPLPEEISFIDYSAAAIRGSRIAITSQESSAVWIGEMKVNKDGSIDPSSFDILPKGQIYNFPRDDECRVEYCNIEGVDFINDRLLVAVSDKMKSRGRQDFRCLQKDQSLHVFAIP
mmetsp:Transcript_22156/g.63195  ORF Transcript_22156/g.63195 Transcript_22156/m.63195 type:complete len:427 (-) Transcript_22156:181-1461(-)